MKTIEISDGLAQEIEGLKQEAITAMLVDASQTFIDITEVGTPKGSKIMMHSLTGKRIFLSGVWEE